ncbi:flagellar biosynthetic protein FliO [Clostridium sp. Cult2]|uniref:flagellar biosynthetic protein FliO n=1 Tax=Clostridium sp. Cult2 TaxID=2079003 RepID=UPI001F1C34E0|nr:flagellar biosynthetic protein FliO [Clostridium sp. Cult2]
MGKALLKFVFYIIIIFIVLIIAIYGTRFIAKSSKRFISSKYIRIIDSLNLGVNFKILMIEINNKIYILAVTNNNIEVIDRISKDDFDKNLNFQEHLNKYSNSYFKDNEFLNKIQWNIKEILMKPNKGIDKEDEYNEKDN